MIPHFSLPFRIVNGAAAVSDQNSDAEIGDCVAAVCLTQKGQRIEEPTYGIDDPTFLRGDQAAAALLQEIEPWEPRADIHLISNAPIIATAIELTISTTPGGS